MDKKLSDTINNICTILGGALLLYPLIDEAAKTIIPEMQRLSLGEAPEKLSLAPPEQKPEEQPQARIEYPSDGVHPLLEEC